MVKIPEEYFGKCLKYDDICDILHEKHNTNAKARREQIENWEIYYQIEKVKGKYIVVKEYDEPDVSCAKTKQAYTEYIEALILSMLYEEFRERQIEPVMYKTYNELFCDLALTNEQYYQWKHLFDRRNRLDQKQKEIKKDIEKRIVNELPTKITKDLEEIEGGFESIKSKMIFREMAKMDYAERNIEKYYSISYSMLKRTVDNALKSMQKRFIINYSTTFKVYKRVFYEDSETGVKKVKTVGRIVTTEEENKILSILSKGLEEFGIKNEDELVKLRYSSLLDEKELYLDYNLYCSSLIQKEVDCDFYGKCLKIVYGRDAVKRELEYKIQTKQILNNNIVAYLRKSKQLDEIDKIVREYLIETNHKYIVKN